MRRTTARLQKSARIRAEEEARRVPWQRLQETRDQYIDWQEFCFWARSILETEKGIPDWLVAVLQTRCPGFLEKDRALASKASLRRPLALRLEDWIDNNIFGVTKQEGWFFAVTYYAIRDPRYQRAEVCWSECVEKWKKVKPIGCAWRIVTGEPVLPINAPRKWAEFHFRYAPNGSETIAAAKHAAMEKLRMIS